MEQMKEPSKGKQLKRVVRAAIYARYSSEMQSSTSAQDQVNRITRLANADMIESRLYSDCRVQVLPDWIFRDEAVTGKVAGRHGYQTLLAGIRKKEFEVVIVDDLSRLTRSLGNLLDLYQLLKHHDIELISISDKVSSADANAKTFFTVKGMVADFGNDAHSERTRRGLEARARDSLSTGQKPYGYESTATKTDRRKNREVPSHFKITIHQERAEIVRRIFTLYADGFGKSYIAKLLNGEKIPPPRGSANGWLTGVIDKILHNEKYIGRWVYNKATYSYDPDTQRRVRKLLPRQDWIVNDAPELRIIAQGVWEQVKSLQKKNVEARKKHTQQSHKGIFGLKGRQDNLHLLSGVLICSSCEGGMAIVSGRREGYYGCIAAHRHGTCGNKTLLRRNKAEDAVLTYLNENLVSNTEIIRYATDKYNSLMRDHLKQAPNRKKEVERELGRVSGELQNLIRFIAEGKGSDLDALTDAIRDRESRKAILSQELSTLDQSDDRKLLVTPYSVQARIAEMVKTLSEKGDRYNSLMKGLFEKSLFVYKDEKEFNLKGQINLGYAMGSRHCTSVLPAGFEPAIFAVRGRRPGPLDDGSPLLKCIDLPRAFGAMGALY